MVRCGTGPSSRCVLVPLLFYTLFAADINVAYTPFKADEDIVDALFGAPEGENGGGGAGGETGVKLVLQTSLSGMLYADNGVVAQSPE